MSVHREAIRNAAAIVTAFLEPEPEALFPAFDSMSVDEVGRATAALGRMCADLVEAIALFHGVDAQAYWAETIMANSHRWEDA